MYAYFPKTPLLWCLLLSLLAIASACGSGSGTPALEQPIPPTPTTLTLPTSYPAPSQPTGTPTLTSTPTPTSTQHITPTTPITTSHKPTYTVTITPGEGLDTLAGYRMEIRFSFKDQYHAGKEGSTTMIMQVNAISQTISAQLAMTGSSFAYMPRESSAMEMYTIDQSSYMSSTIAATGEITCTRIMQDIPTPPLDPNRLIGMLSQARLINKGSNINGVTTDHYVLDNAKSFFSEMQSVETAMVHFWVAQEGGYLVKLDAEATGTHRLPTARSLPHSTPETAQGTFIMTYLLSDIDVAIPIALPEECINARDMPLPTPTLLVEGQ